MSTEHQKGVIGDEKLREYEERVLAAVPELYKDPEDRAIVTGILIPHFKEQLLKVLAAFQEERYGLLILTPVHYAELCKKIDSMIAENRELLDLEGTFKPIFEEIQAVRNEAAEYFKKTFYEECRNILAEKGVTSKNGLISKGSQWFKKEDFSELGGGKRFAGIILGRKFNHVGVTELGAIADALGYENDKLKICRDILKIKGVCDRQDLFNKGPVWFKKEDFGEYGKGVAFARLILERQLRMILRSDLEEIADVLGFEKDTEEVKILRWRKLLGEKGIVDRQDLLNKGPVWFRNADFGVFGKGRAFAAAILGKFSTTLLNPALEEIADVLGFEKDTEEVKILRWRKLLEEKGITERTSLMKKGVKSFRSETFGGYGKGCAFAAAILGRPFSHVAVTDLIAIADALGYENDKLKICRDILKVKGVCDRQGLLNKGPEWFKKEAFGEYGKGLAFAGFILGRTIDIFRISNLEEIADFLF